MAKWHSSGEWAKARAYAKTVLEPYCTVCNKELAGEDWTIDHIVPSDPPNHDIANLQSMCRECNGRKSDKNLHRVNWHNARFYTK